MATYTENLNLKKPAETDFVDVADINENMEAIDHAIASNEQKIAVVLSFAFLDFAMIFFFSLSVNLIVSVLSLLLFSVIFVTSKLKSGSGLLPGYWVSGHPDALHCPGQVRD